MNTMLNTKKEIILMDSPEAAQEMSVKGWVSRNGVFCGQGESGERAARYDGATHRKCDKCDKIMLKNDYCKSCRYKDKRAEFLNLPLDSIIYPVAEWDGYEFFFEEEELLDYLSDVINENPDLTFNDIMLVRCIPNYIDEIDASIFDHKMPDDWDGELPDEIQKALDALNMAIRSHREPISWGHGRIRVSVEELWKKVMVKKEE